MYFFLSWEDELMFGHIILKLQIGDIWPPHSACHQGLEGVRDPMVCFQKSNHYVSPHQKPSTVLRLEGMERAHAGSGASASLSMAQQGCNAFRHSTFADPTGGMWVQE